MKLRNFLIGLFAVSALVANLAHANHDGADHEAKHENHFKEADTNNDGKLTYDEFKAGHDKRMQEMFKRMDANNDGAVDASEKKAMREKMREHRKGKEGCKHHQDGANHP